MTYCTYPGCMNNTLGQCQGACLLRPQPPIANTAGGPQPGSREWDERLFDDVAKGSTPEAGDAVREALAWADACDPAFDPSDKALKVLAAEVRRLQAELSTLRASDLCGSRSADDHGPIT